MSAKALLLKRNEYIELAPEVWLKWQDLGVNPGVSIYSESPRKFKMLVLKNWMLYQIGRAIIKKHIISEIAESKSLSSLALSNSCRPIG
ncbi:MULTISPECIES: hypothetical protein [Aerosakkonema]|uniref:hypothetical protein n=1 Tax=Aerosakkonema TaxID=1246629 RepID=UPI0035B7EE93